MPTFKSKIGIVSVDEYNRDAEQRYRDAMARFNADSRSGFPSRAMHFFCNMHGEVRRSGYVVHTGSSYRWVAIKRKAVEILLEWLKSEGVYESPDL